MQIKKLKSIRVSFKWFTTAFVIAVCVILMFVYSMISERIYKNKYIQEIDRNMDIQCKLIINVLQRNDFLIDDEHTDLDEYLEFTSRSFNGRILIINSDYRIIKDTYKYNENALIISDEIIETMIGTKDMSSDIGEGSIHYMYPAKDIDGNIRAVLIINASTEKLDNITAYTRNRNIVVAIFLVIASTILSMIFSMLSVRGMRFVGDQMQLITDGHITSKIEPRGFKETQAITESYNNTMNKLMAIDSTRQEFVSNVSHELKTPITSMKVLADSIVQNDEADLLMYKEFMSDIVEEIDRETKIINDLLTLVKTDKQSAKLNIETISVNDLLEVILKRVSPIAELRGIEILYESYKEVTADVDEIKLSLALSNIIENAVKYNVDGGTVRVTLNADNKNFYIKVSDTGVGIPDDCKNLVFERFYRVDKARSRDTGGTGLGLSITKNVISMHKGTIKLYSESGEGTTFTVKIPMKR